MGEPRKYEDLSGGPDGDKALIDALLERHSALIKKPKAGLFDPDSVATANLIRTSPKFINADAAGQQEMLESVLGPTLLVTVPADVIFSSTQDMVDWVTEVANDIEDRIAPPERLSATETDPRHLSVFPISSASTALIWSTVAQSLLVINADLPTDTISQRIIAEEVARRTAEVRTFPEHFLKGQKLGAIYRNQWVKENITDEEFRALQSDRLQADPELQAFVDREQALAIADLPAVMRMALDQQGDVGEYGADRPGDFDIEVNRQMDREERLPTEESIFTSETFRVTKPPPPIDSSNLFQLDKDQKLDLAKAATDTFLRAKSGLNLSTDLLDRAEDGFKNATAKFQARLVQLQAELEGAGASPQEIANALTVETNQFVSSGELAQSVEQERLDIFDAPQSAKTNVIKRLRDSGDGFVESDFTAEFFDKMVLAVGREGSGAFDLFPLERLLEEKAFAEVDTESERKAIIKDFLGGRDVGEEVVAAIDQGLQDAGTAAGLEFVTPGQLDALAQAETNRQLLPAPLEGIEGELAKLGIRGSPDFQASLEEEVIPRLTPLLEQAVATDPAAPFGELLEDALEIVDVPSFRLDPISFEAQTDPGALPSPFGALADFPELITNIVGQVPIEPEPLVDLGLGDLTTPEGQRAFELEQLNLTGELAEGDLFFQEELIRQLPELLPEFEAEQQERLSARQTGIREERGFLTVGQTQVLNEARNRKARATTAEDRALAQAEIDKLETQFRETNLSTAGGRALSAQVKSLKLSDPLEPADFGAFVKKRAPAIRASFEALPATIGRRQREAEAAERTAQASEDRAVREAQASEDRAVREAQVAESQAESERRRRLRSRGRTVIRGRA